MDEHEFRTGTQRAGGNIVNPGTRKPLTGEGSQGLTPPHGALSASERKKKKYTYKRGVGYNPVHGSLRDIFAASVITGMYARGNITDFPAAADQSYQQADAMLKARANG